MTRGSEPAIEWPVGGAGRRVFVTATSGAPPALLPLLAPLEQLYSGVTALRNRAYDHGLFKQQRVAVPVISVGNIVAGGSGKTPVTRWLTEQLLARARRPAVLHSGYGMDEPRLHQQWHTEVIVIAQKDRVAGAERAIAAGADVIILDDAFQHRRLARDLDIVLLPAESANTHLLPRGPGRERMTALGRSNFVLITRKSAATDAAVVLETAVHRVAPRVPTGRVHLKLATSLPPGPVLAVSAIARPDLFLTQLRALGAQVELLLAYPDHYEYTRDDVAHIMRRAGPRLVVTTEKDAIKLRELLTGQPLHVVGQRVDFESGEAGLLAALDNML